MRLGHGVDSVFPEVFSDRMDAAVPQRQARSSRPGTRRGGGQPGMPRREGKSLVPNRMEAAGKSLQEKNQPPGVCPLRHRPCSAWPSPAPRLTLLQVKLT